MYLRAQKNYCKMVLADLGGYMIFTARCTSA